MHEAFLHISSPASWSAVAACVGVLLALIGGMVAFGQLSEARRLRLEQAQPYVVVSMEGSPAGSWVIDLVIKNLGQTAATDVRLKFTPALQRAAPPGSNITAVAIPDSIPLLVPGQEWRTLWDTTQARKDSKLPDEHTVSVTFRDLRGKQSFGPFTFVLDWKITQRDVVSVHGMHDAAGALQDIRSLLRDWREISGRGVRVFTRDGDAFDRRNEDEYARREREERQPEQEADGPPAVDSS
jgi:hypothetical protein